MLCSTCILRRHRGYYRPPARHLTPPLASSQTPLWVSARCPQRKPHRVWECRYHTWGSWGPCKVPSSSLKQWNCSKRTICTSTMAHLSTWTYQQSPQQSPHLHQVLVRPKASHLSRPWPTPCTTCIIIQKSPNYLITWSLPPPLAKVLHHHLASSSVHWPRSPLWD